MCWMASACSTPAKYQPPTRDGSVSDSTDSSISGAPVPGTGGRSGGDVGGGGNTLANTGGNPAGAPVGTSTGGTGAGIGTGGEMGGRQVAPGGTSGIAGDPRPSGTGGATGGQGGQSCTSTQHVCSGACVDNNSTAHCGALCEPCVPPAGGTATCDGTRCDFSCGPMRKCATQCTSGCCIDADCPTLPGMAGQCDTSTNACSYACMAGFKPCGAGTCIPKSGCCSASDCPGICTTCAAGTCVAVTSADDLDSCPGTCDAAGACKSKRGQTCNTGAGCVSGTTCSPDGYCCNTACTGSCQACDMAGSLGTCGVVTGAAHAGHPSCGASGNCAGTCGGALATCTFPGAETTCGPGTCTSGKSTKPAVCNGAGTCQPSMPTSCAPFTCGPIECLASCTSNADCASGAACVNAACTACTGIQTVCTNACADLSSSVANCGSCGHSCQGGACAGGVCQPTLVAGGFSAGPLAVGSDSVYVVDYGSGGRLLRISKANGTITPIASGNIWDVAVFGGAVYWTTWTTSMTTSTSPTDGKVTRAALDGTSSRDIATGQATARGLVVDADGAYWITGNGATDGVIMRLAATDAAPFPFATMQASLDAIAADVNNVYWMTLGAIGDGSDGAVFSKPKR